MKTKGWLSHSQQLCQKDWFASSLLILKKIVLLPSYAATLSTPFPAPWWVRVNQCIEYKQDCVCRALESLSAPPLSAAADSSHCRTRNLESELSATWAAPAGCVQCAYSEFANLARSLFQSHMVKTALTAHNTVMSFSLHDWYTIRCSADLSDTLHQ